MVENRMHFRHWRMSKGLEIQSFFLVTGRLVGGIADILLSHNSEWGWSAWK